ncbi:hypothetical protein [Nocardiopsis composta]|uniref:DivIVA domain-containing protein n=1 Tax=Nocardiopsis composta TaxID=157465 RepID=A0A7W8QMJ0_9ACTN|nr:hypothetical protein [Nocardiopsis composta]MBB5433217.1 hypothetical protein [Nocardiopsis composta]
MSDPLFGAPSSRPGFDVVLRGHHRGQVNEWFDGAPSPSAGTDRVPGFDVVLRGYDRKQVEAAIERVLQGAAEQGGPA